MKTVRLDKSTVVPAIAMGTWMIGRQRELFRQEEAALRTGIDLGLSVIDTAELYCNEAFLGDVIARSGLRDRVFLTSKVLPENAGFAGTIHACERSLAALKTDRIDLFLLHWRSSHPLEETVRAMEKLLCDGKIARWGVSNLDVADMERLARIDSDRHCCNNQVLYNLTERGIEFDLIDWHRRHGVLTSAYSPIGEGRLCNDPLLEEIGRRHGASAAQIALAWSIRSGAVMAVAKAGNAGHMRENVLAMEIELTPQDLSELDARFAEPEEKVVLRGW